MWKVKKGGEKWRRRRERGSRFMGRAGEKDRPGGPAVNSSDISEGSLFFLFLPLQ